MSARDFIPGVPAAGHITSGGYWHPSAASNCHKSPCRRENARSQPHRFEADPGRRDNACRECGEPESYYQHPRTGDQR